MIPENLTYEQLIKDMKACEQTKGMNVLEHGSMVHYYYTDLMDHLTNADELEYVWKIPSWVYDNSNTIIEECCQKDTMKEYMELHDCGKPYCHIVDDDGKRHFPNHATVSHEVYCKLFPEKKIIAQLIRMDMDVHCLKGEDVEKFSQHILAISLLISALCEIHANASMFGGIESTSFKIKWKQIDKRGRQVWAAMPNR
jgi:hypothetical protein